MQDVLATLRTRNAFFNDQFSLAFVGNGILSLVDILFTPGIQHDLFNYLNPAQISFIENLMEIIQS